MNDAVIQLRLVVSKYGPEICEDARRIEALLRDLAGEHRREIFALVGSVRVGIPAAMLASSNTLPASVLEERLVQVLCDDLSLASEVARWAVAAWAWALEVPGLLSRGRRTAIKT